MAETTSPKRTVRRKAVSIKTSQQVSSPMDTTLPPEALIDLSEQFVQEAQSIRESCEQLKRAIEETRQAWKKEQEQHDRELRDKQQEEEIVRKRDSETYRYETELARRRVKDEFEQKRLAWERELAEQKDELRREKEELDMLHKQVAQFDAEKVKLSKEVTLSVQKDLTNSFKHETELREQEVKAERELLGLKIQNLTSETTRQAQEIAILKKALEDATHQLKDVAMKVIESHGQPGVPFPQSEPQSKRS